MSSKTLVLITGASSGIAFTLAALLLEDSAKHVILCSRSVSKGKTAVQNLQSKRLPGTVELLELDVASEPSVAHATQYLTQTHGRLDALVNNAGVFAFPPEASMKDQMQQSFLINATGPQLVTTAFLPLLKASPHTPRIINVSFGGGSIAIRLTPAYDHPLMGSEIQYRASKAAENMVSASMFRELGPWGWKVFTYNPGFTESNLGPNNKVSKGAKSTVEGARPMVEILNGKKDDLAGKNITGEWNEVPW